MVAERIRAAIEQSVVPAADQQVLFTVSLGVADFCDRLDDTLQRADGALYAAKQDGRNCVRSNFAREPPAGCAPPPALAV
jgi:diguanylate cyclase (GGDEF)-like protein